MRKPLIILTGPTAVGKSALSIKLAKVVNGEIISADSMQVYKEMNIGTAKITEAQMQGVPHYLIDILSPSEDFNVVKFQKLAKQAMQEIYAKGKIPIVVGGTGFYIQSLVYDIDFKQEEENQDLRKRLVNEAIEMGPEAFHSRLGEIDAKAAGEIHPNNTKKIVRALEFYYQTGELISEHNEIERKKESPYNFCYFVLNQPREYLYERIDRRVDDMIKRGLLEEVDNLRKKGYDKNLVSMQGLGYKEILAYFNRETSLDEAIYTLKRDTRHFAKRQITWFKREKEVIWLSKETYDSEEELFQTILLSLKEKEIL